MGCRPVHHGNFDDVMRHGLVVLTWRSSRSAPCAAFERELARVAAVHPDVVFATVDVDHEQALARAFAIHKVPTAMVFWDGELLWNGPECSIPTLAKRIAEARHLRTDSGRFLLVCAEDLDGRHRDGEPA